MAGVNPGGISGSNIGITWSHGWMALLSKHTKLIILCVHGKKLIYHVINWAKMIILWVNIVWCSNSYVNKLQDYCLLEKHLKRDGTPSCQTSRYPATASASFSRTSSPTKLPDPTKSVHWYCGNSERRSHPSWKPYSWNPSTPENYQTTESPPTWSPYTKRIETSTSQLPASLPDLHMLQINGTHRGQPDW